MTRNVAVKINTSPVKSCNYFLTNAGVAASLVTSNCAKYDFSKVEDLRVWVPKLSGKN